MTFDKKRQMDISFIIVNWNTRELLLNCIRSIKENAESFSSEIIVVDNDSEDDSVQAVRAQFPDVVLIENEKNVGFAKANNIGMSQSTGRYVCLINSDVILIEGCLSSLYSHMEQHEDIGVIAPKILNRDLSLQESCKEFPTIWNSLCRALALDTAFPHSRLFSAQLMRYWRHEEIRPVDILSGCFWTVRRAALTKVGPLDERFFMYAEDKDWCMRFWKSGWPVVYYPPAQAIHLTASSSARDPIRFYVEMTRANLRYWKKHYGWARQLAIRAIMLLHESLRIIGAAVNLIIRPSSRDAAIWKFQRSMAVMKLLVIEHFPTGN